MGGALPAAESATTDERQEQLRAIASGLLSWTGGLKVLRQVQLPKWRSCFQWQIVYGFRCSSLRDLPDIVPLVPALL